MHRGQCAEREERENDQKEMNKDMIEEGGGVKIEGQNQRKWNGK